MAKRNCPDIAVLAGTVLKISDRLCGQDGERIFPYKLAFSIIALRRLLSLKQAWIFVMTYKEMLSLLAIALTFFAFYPYIRSIMKNRIKPHVFSWVIWGTTTFIVFLAQLEDGGGAGAWPIGVSGVITIYVAFLAYLKTSDSTITRADWCFFLSAMVSLPLWYLTSDPLWAVVILTIVDMLGFGPTLRKAYYYPFQEGLTFFLIVMGRNLVVIMALEHYSLTTVLFPAVIAAACLLLCTVVLFRRHILSGTA